MKSIRSRISERLPCLACLALCFPTLLYAQRDLQDIPDPDPEIERSSFIVADGFEVNLYAADPLIAKPIQMNFDAEGRLWVASSSVYPQIMPGQPADDKILILEDKDQDGTAETTSVFADGLLIPTGVIPGDGGAYVVNSTELLHLSDTDNDGKADRRKIVLSGFGTEDTHHLLHTLRWGHDGCLYMNQSIYIHSHVETPYGVKRLNGGGIWRFRPETLELDVLSYGLVNPWGHHFDAWGQSFATDGAGREGINYVFPGSVFVTAPGAERFVSGLNPGSPKHCGLEVVSGRHLPDDWQGSLLTNDFRAHRVCRFVLSEDGSGYASRQEVEPIKSTHVAFRPIDVKMGPDGAIYIADWYNPIIQHGEVDFRDSRRDHVHGRIWRVTAKNRPLVKRPNFKGASIAKLLDVLKEPEEWNRTHAKLLLKARDADDVETSLQSWTARLDPDSPLFNHHLLEALWVHQAIGRPNVRLLRGLSQSLDHRVRSAAIRVAVDWMVDGDTQYQHFMGAGIRDEHPRVRLEALRGLAKFQSLSAAEAAMLALDKPLDRFLDFALWQTMRDLEPYWLPAVQEGKVVFDGDIDKLAFALRAIDSPAVVEPLLTLIASGKVADDQVAGVLMVMANLGGAEDLGQVFALASSDARLSNEDKAELLEALVAATNSRKVIPTGDLAALRTLIKSSDPRVRAAALRAAGEWKQESLRDVVSKLALNTNVDRQERDAAIDAVTAFNGPESVKTLNQLSMLDNYDDRLRAVRSLSVIAPKLAAQRAVEVLKTLPEGSDPSLVLEVLLGRKNGPAELIAALANTELDVDVAKMTLRAVRSSSQQSPELIAAIQKAGGLSEAGWKLTPELLQELVAEVAASGDAHRGEAIFRQKELQCAKCHAIGGAGGRVGPDLISVGASAQVDYLVQSLLTPNSKLKENFHSLVIATDDGRIVTGIPIRQSDTEIVLRDAEDREITIPVNSIEEKQDGRSLMPDGSVDQLTRGELVDLVRFLSELGKVGDFAIGNAQVVRRWQTLTWTEEGNYRLNRTSYDIAATDDPALTWESAYSRVGGDLPLDGLPQVKPHRETPQTSFVRFDLEVSTPGAIRLQINSIDGLSLWVDSKPTPLQGDVKLELDRGSHRINFAIDRETREMPLRVELVGVPGSEAQAQLVSGK
ncbi:MAG: c-type cytochrome [Planctomycetaceae bacterium]|nr:c-type cytochrome [Planctomycetaceae bacterium]